MPPFILDTNAIHYLVNPCWTSEAKRSRLLERAEDGQLVINYTPIAPIEMVSQIEADHSKFDVIKAAASMLVDLGAIPLPDPEDVMGAILTDNPYSQEKAEIWGDIIDILAKGNDAQSIVTGFADYTSGKAKRLDMPSLAEFRARYEKNYRDDWKSVLSSIVPDFEKKVATGRHTRLGKSEASGLDDFLKNSAEWKNALLNILTHRSQKPLPTKDYDISTVMAKIKYFREGLEWLIRQSAEAGLRPDSLKRKNDYNDLHLLLYINDYNSCVLVSQDKEFSRKVSCAGCRLITYPKFLAQATDVGDGA